MRTVIVGGGVVGLLTALECARAGHRVTLVEQGRLPNPHAASHDRHRVLRALHPDDPGATRAGVAAHHAWRVWEAYLGVRCYHQVGALTGLAPHRVDSARALLAAAGGGGHALDPIALARRWPHLCFPAGAGAVYEERAGVLLADRILEAAVHRLRHHPRVQLLAHTAVVRLDVADRSVILADGRVLRGDRLLVAAGAWARTLLPPVAADRLVLHRQTVLYCAVPREQHHAWTGTPAVAALDAGSGAWLVPPVADAPLGLSAHEVARVVPSLAGRDAAVRWTRTLRERFAPLVPGFHPGWITGARDCYFVADAVTGGALLLDLADGEVFADAASAGGSFKFAPLTARMLAIRLSGGAPPPTGLRSLDRPLRIGTGRLPDPPGHLPEQRTW
ncbi:NAD(P)/FAD-dependent oxidoreductase [Embleya hyalina]|nr:FAD-dependent oxidoreductase [Embleya hyalina]